MSVQNKIEQLKMQQLQKNEADGAAFIENYSKQANAIVLEEGIVYTVLQEGDGINFPTVNQTVHCHYHGTLINGTIFDSSVQRGQPISFPLNAVIQGWQIAIPLMSVGAKHQIVIPAHLAYGNRNAGPIAAGSTLIFDVELLAIK
jgi:FKBP-type peptidyl-prolyl cis-trans isomerase FklB